MNHGVVNMTLKIESLTDQSIELKDTVRKALVGAIGQRVPIINVLKSTRKSGVSVRPVIFVLEGGQEVSFLVRQGGDVFRVQINGKDFPLTGDITLDQGRYQKQSFDLAIKQIADAVRKGQAAFDKKKTTAKIVTPPAKDDKGRTIPKNTTQMLKQVIAEEAEIDAVITQKTEQRDTMKLQLEQKLAQAPLPAPAM